METSIVTAIPLRALGASGMQVPALGDSRYASDPKSEGSEKSARRDPWQGG